MKSMKGHEGKKKSGFSSVLNFMLLHARMVKKSSLKKLRISTMKSMKVHEGKKEMKQSSTFYAKTGKRIFDVALTIPGLIVISPVLAITALLVRVKLGSPVLFRQVRPGLHGNPFTIYKFRTMTDERDADGNLLPDGERLTRFGGLLSAIYLEDLSDLPLEPEEEPHAF